jgi:excisionase family DNA binding protein
MEKQSPETAAEPLAVDVRGAARLLSLSRSTILNMADRGELTRIRMGRSVRYSTRELADLIEERRRSASQGAAREAGLFRVMPGDQQQ